MSEKTKNTVAGLFLTSSVSVICTLLVLGLFIFVFQWDGFIPDDIDNTSSDNSSEISDGTIIEIRDFEEVVIPIAEKLKPSIVGIRVSVSNGISGGSTYEASGVIYSEDGYIITNQHVLSPAMDQEGQVSQGSKIEVFVEGSEDSFEGEIIGTDGITDLALLKISAEKLIPADFGDSESIVVGQMVVAIGSPGGLEFMGSVSQGIISGIDRRVEFEDGTMMELLQTDAAVNPGNSGGALVNSKGEVIGINNAGLEKDKYEGINFAIPSNLVLEIIGDLKTKGYISGRSWIGIFVSSDFEYESLKSLYDLPDGVFVDDVDPDSPAEIAGIKKNDVIVKFDGIDVKGMADLRQILNERNPGETYSLTVYRLLGDEYIEMDIVLGERIS